MSHYIGLTMLDHSVDGSDVIDAAQKIANHIFENNMKDEIRSNITYSPNFENISITNKEDIYRLNDTDRIFLRDIFCHKFLYWKKYGLLAVIGEYKNIPDTQRLYFQNSCDQNEEYEFWNVIMNNNDERTKAFRDMAVRVQSGEADDDIRTYFEEDKIEDMDYYRKTYLYKFIEEQLNIVKYLYNGPANDIQTFFVSSVTTSHKLAQLYTAAIKVYTDYAADLLKYVQKDQCV